jgi:hypothetical protein
MNERIEELLEQARTECRQLGSKPATTVGYDELEQFAELVEAAAVAREREACAKLCEDLSVDYATAERCADSIRARGDK